LAKETAQVQLSISGCGKIKWNY